MHRFANRAYTIPVSTLSKSDFLPLLRLGLEEDAPAGDKTSDSIIPDDKLALGKVVAREDGLLCGIGIIHAIEELFPSEISIHFKLEDGELLNSGKVVLVFESKARLLLRIERVLLNFIQYMSGISSETNRIVRNYPNIHIMDTRKTLPGYRKLVKYCVYIGGGWNHRINLSDMAMIKDNHLAIAGSITKAVGSIRKHQPSLILELEIDSLVQLEEAIESRPDIILLDNFSNEDLNFAIQKIRDRNPSIGIEVSGGITPEKLEYLSTFGSIGVSMGYLTHTTRFFDIGLDIDT